MFSTSLNTFEIIPFESTSSNLHAIAVPWNGGPSSDIAVFQCFVVSTGVEKPRDVAFEEFLQ